MAKKKDGVDLQFSVDQSEALSAIRDITSNINTMNKQLNLTNVQLDSNNASIETYQSKLSILEKQQAQLAEKVSLSYEMHKKAVEVYGEDSKEAQKWQNTLIDNQTALQKVNNQIDSTTSEMNKFGEEEEKTSEKTSIFGDVLKANLISDALTNGLKSLVSGIEKIGSAFTGAISSGAKYADEILTMSTQTGLSTEALQKYQAVSELVDVSTDTLTSSMAKNIKQMAAGNDAYKTLGVSVTDANGNLRDSEEVYWECIDALGNISNETERNSIAMSIFGKSAQDLNPLIALGSQGINELTAEASKMGAVLNSEGLKALGSLDDEMQKFSTITSSTGNIIASAFAPALSSLLGDVNEIGGSFNNLIASILGGDEGTIEEATNQFITYINDFINNLSIQIPKMMEIGNNLITSLINVISSNLPTILQSGIQLITTLINGMTSNLNVILPAIIQVINSLSQAIILNLPTILSSGIQIILELCNGLISAIPSLIPIIISSLLTVVNTILDNIDLIIDSGIQIILGLCDGLISALPTLIDQIPIIIEKLISAVTNNLPKLVTLGIELTVKLGVGLIKAIPKLVAKIPEIITSLVNGLKDGISKMGEVGLDLIKGLWQGIKDSFKWIKDKIKEWVGNVFDFIKNLFGIHSPSKLFEDEIGLNIGLGTAEGILDSIPHVQNAMSELSDEVTTAVDPELSMSRVTQENITPAEIRPIYLNIDTFNNNSDKDIESLAEELAFYLKQKEVTG